MNNKSEAAGFPESENTVLLAVTGMSPAILTETIWALANPVDGAEPVIPARVIVVTTSEGRGHIEQLFRPSPQLENQCPWDALRAALEALGHSLAGRLRFGLTADDIRVITAAEPGAGRSVELADIRDRADNEAAADFLLEQVRGIVENPDSRLIVSIAGGRKTMSALLYACMTLIGRETDGLTHVLVNEPYETMRDFWFPAQPGGPLRARDGGTHAAGKARIELARVPFVPLRNLFRRELGQPAGTFRRLMDLCRASVRLTAGENLRLEIPTSHTRSRVNGSELALSPREHLVFLFFARRASRSETILSAYDEAMVELNEFRAELRRNAPASDWSDWRADAALDAALEARDLTRILSDIRAKAKRAGGDTAFLADVLPSKGRCALDVPPSMIFIK